MMKEGDTVRLKQTKEHIKYWKNHMCVLEWRNHEDIRTVTEHNQGNGCIKVDHIDKYIGAWRFELAIQTEHLPEDLFTI